ncbi:MAG TPA: NmrA family NAD(P)-binding protein [bacterium]|nr:NmrA family NAD(P)-binding protein [bacterium]
MGKTYAVMGATGHIGRVVAEQLLAKGHAVRALGRDEKKLSALKAKGAQAVTGAFDDAAALTALFNGVDGAFLMTPPSYDAESLSDAQDRVGEAVVKALSATGLKYAVNLSSVGAELPSGSGPITGLYRQEQRLAKLGGLNLVNLRPTAFMENSFFAIPVIKAYGVFGAAAPADYPLPTVATRDIAAKVVEFLEALSFQGQRFFDLTGPREYTQTELVKVLGAAIGKPDLKYQQTPLDQIKAGMLGMGMRPKTVDLMIEMYGAGNAGKLHPNQELTAEHRGSTTLEQFAPAFAAAYQQA